MRDQGTARGGESLVRKVGAGVLDLIGLVGLREPDALARARDEGPNDLPAQDQRNVATIVVEVVREPMFLMLVAAGAVYLLIALDRPGGDDLLARCTRRI